MSTGQHAQLLTGPVLVQADGAALGLLQTGFVAGRRLWRVGRQAAGQAGPRRAAPAPFPAGEPPRRDVVQHGLGQPQRRVLPGRGSVQVTDSHSKVS